jgi:hypothetical protein
MAAPDALGDILDRIANGKETEGDRQTLRQLLRAGDGQNVQLSKNIANIVDAQGNIQIGDRIYQGADAEAIREIVRSLVLEIQQPSWQRRSFLAFGSTVAVLAGVATLGIGSGFKDWILETWSGQKSEDQLAVTCVRQSLKNLPVNISSFDLISTYWEIFISNNDVKDISVINYDLLQVGKDFPAAYYSGMNQGLYFPKESKLVSASFPITILAGSTVNLILKIGIQMNANAYKIAKHKLQKEPKIDFLSLEKYLWSRDIDVYGNQVKPTKHGSYTFPPFGEAKEQVFSIYFKTARGTEVPQLISWYGTLYDLLLRKTC